MPSDYFLGSDEHDPRPFACIRVLRDTEELFLGRLEWCSNDARGSLLLDVVPFVARVLVVERRRRRR
jgi:hypothetical protein